MTTGNASPDNELTARPGSSGTRKGPVIVLSYAYSGAVSILEALAADTTVAATIGTGIIPLCGHAAETWQRLEGRAGPHLSRLAVSTLRALITAQVTIILAEAGKTRWCELATGATGAAQSFLDVFPDATVVAVHRFSLDVVRTALQASPWGLHMPHLVPYLSSYQGNMAAALAAHWADSTEQLLAFQVANPSMTYRIRYEDAAADPVQALASVRSRLGLSIHPDKGHPREPASAGHATWEVRPQPTTLVPPGVMPAALLERIGRLHSELDYPAPGQEP